jgi:pimeloyl-ACP methyl ester carboxylesterase
VVKRGVWGAAAGTVGAAGVAAAGLVARRRHRIAADRRRLATELSEVAAEPGTQPPGEPSSVTADDGVRLSCEEIEATGGPPALTVVLVHGMALDRRTWHFQRSALAQLDGPRVRQVLYDLRSHGRSERAPRETCTIEQLGRDLDAVIRAVAPEGPLVIVAHSMGGMSVMALAEHNPQLFTERVVGVAFMATSAGEVGGQGLRATLLSRRNPFTRTLGLVARVQPALIEGARQATAGIIRNITGSVAYGDRNVAPWLVDLVDAMIRVNAVDALTDFVDTLGSHNRIAALPALATCEVLVLAGDSDKVIPVSHSERIAAELSEAELVVLPGVGHLPMLEQPVATDEALARLVRRAAFRTRPRRVRRRA